MVKEYIKNPVFLAVIVCIIFFYSEKIDLNKKYSFHSLVKIESISEIQGNIISSPIKNSGGKYYSFKFKPVKVKAYDLTESSVFGYCSIFIPADLVESYFPGKLYSSAVQKGAYLYESGGTYVFNGHFTEKGFIVSKCLYNSWKNDVWGKIDFFRALCRLQFKRLMYAWGNAGGLLLALLCGAREYTEKITSDSFRNAGLSHILALSGMHLSLFSNIAGFIGKRLKNLSFTYSIRFIIVLIFVWFAGFSPSLMRAFICSMLLLISSMAFTDKPDMIMILSFSFLIQSVITPTDITNAGFVLSYGALAGILLFSGKIQKVTDSVLPAVLSSSFAASTGAQFFTAPVSLKIFGSFAPGGIIASTIVSPLINLFIYSGLISIVLSLIFPLIASYSGIFMNFQYNIIKEIVILFSKLPRILI